MPFKALRERIVTMDDRTFRAVSVVATIGIFAIIGSFLFEWHAMGAPIPMELRNFAIAAAPILSATALVYLRYLVGTINIRLEHASRERQQFRTHLYEF